MRPAFRRELTPTWLSATTLLAGHRPPDPDRPLRVLDLHCGVGVTAAVIAAVHPAAEVWAVDDRPAMVERTDRLVASAALRNITVLEAGLADDALPSSIDVALIDDVVSTTNSSGRAQLAASIVRHVRPGGLVVVGYRTRIGWSEVIPLRCLALLFAQAGQVPVSWQRRAIVDLLVRLRAGGASYITDRSAVSALVELTESMEEEQLAEVLLTPHLEPMGFVDVAEWLAPSGAAFLGTARLGDLDIGDESPLHELLDDTQDDALREAFRDLITRATYRIDVFRRGSAPLPAETKEAMLLGLELVAIGERSPTRVDGDALEDDGLLTRAVDRLRDRSAVVGELVAARNVRQAEQLVRMLMVRGLAHPRSAGWGVADAASPCCALNRCLGQPDLMAPAGILAAPEIGSAIPLISGTGS